MKNIATLMIMITVIMILVRTIPISKENITEESNSMETMIIVILPLTLIISTNILKTTGARNKIRVRYIGNNKVLTPFATNAANFYVWTFPLSCAGHRRKRERRLRKHRGNNCKEMVRVSRLLFKAKRLSLFQGSLLKRVDEIHEVLGYRMHTLLHTKR